MEFSSSDTPISDVYAQVTTWCGSNGKSVSRRHEVWSTLFRARTCSTCTCSFVSLFESAGKSSRTILDTLPPGLRYSEATSILKRTKHSTQVATPASSYREIRIERSSQSPVPTLFPPCRLPVTGRVHTLSINEDSSSIPCPPNF